MLFELDSQNDVRGEDAWAEVLILTRNVGGHSRVAGG